MHRYLLCEGSASVCYIDQELVSWQLVTLRPSLEHPEGTDFNGTCSLLGARGTFCGA